MEHMSVEEYRLYKENETKQKKNNKFGNKIVYVDGMKFDSEFENQRWEDLKNMQRAKEIKNLRRQVKFELQPSYIKNDKVIQPINYVADFVYYDINKRGFIIEDTKGYKTEIYKLKKKIFEYKYPDLEIKEIRKEDI